MGSVGGGLSMMEQMLESLKKKTEEEKAVSDYLPPLPQRPRSRGQLPSKCRMRIAALHSASSQTKSVLASVPESEFEEEEVVLKASSGVEKCKDFAYDECASCNNANLCALIKISRLEESSRMATLRGIISIQSSFRTHVMRTQFMKMRSCTIFLQGLVRSRVARKEYTELKERDRAAITIQKEVRRRIARKSYGRRLKMVILVQAVSRGWLDRRHTDMYRQQLLTEHLNATNIKVEDKHFWDLNLWKSNDIYAENKQSTEDRFKEASISMFPPSLPTDIQNYLAAIDAALREKEEEIALLRQRVEEYERRWIESEVKMSSMENMWEKQLSSFQESLAAAAQKCMAAEELLSEQVKYDEITLLQESDEFDSGEVSWQSDSQQNKESDEAGQPMKEFEQRKYVSRDFDANFSLEVKSGQTEEDIITRNQELHKPKSRFKMWKKGFKIGLCETKTALQKLGHNIWRPLRATTKLPTMRAVCS